MTNYIENLNQEIQHKTISHNTKVLDLFAGCGGLALGFEAQGFETYGYEMNADCCSTYNKNLNGHCEKVYLTTDTEYPKVPIVIGGPPCQPFSVGGKQKGVKDDRNGFPVFILAIEQIQPDIFLFENVRGLLFRNKWYLDEIISRFKKMNYIVEFRLMNAINFGVPQNRERVIVVGHKGKFVFPEPLKYRVTAGEALGEMAFQIPDDVRFLTPNMDLYIANYERASKCINPRDLKLDKPARTLTCRNLAGATGDMQRIRLQDGRRRRLTTKEAARLQSFPDWFEFVGSVDSIFNQIGNAVPPFFSYHLAKSVLNYLESPLRHSGKNLNTIIEKDEQISLFIEKGSNNKMSEGIFIDKSKKSKTFNIKTLEMQQLINQSLHIITSLGVPFEGLTSRTLERMGMAFLAVADIKNLDNWQNIKDYDSGRSMKTRDIIDYWNENFNESISKGSYDNIRRKDLKLMVLAGIIINTLPDSATNNPSRGYAINPEFTELIKSYDTEEWQQKVDIFMANIIPLREKMKQKRDLMKIEVKVPSGKIIEFSSGEHNELQKQIIEAFLPYFGYGAELLYVGDTAKKHIVYEEERLKELGFFSLEHEELPDVIAYSEQKNWLFVIEAVHACNPVTILRKLKLEELTANCSADIVYVSAFLNRKAFIEFAAEIAWETEVWISDNPEHMIHFNGDKFLGPYKE